MEDVLFLFKEFFEYFFGKVYEFYEDVYWIYLCEILGYVDFVFCGDGIDYFIYDFMNVWFDVMCDLGG